MRRIPQAASSVVLLLFCLCVPVRAGAADALVVAVSESPPWRMILDGEAAGIDVDILREAASRIGLALRFEFASPQDCLRRVKRGRADLATGQRRLSERESWLIYVTPPYVTGTTSVFYASPARASAIDRYEILHPLRIGVGRGEMHFPQFDHDGELRKVRTRGVADGFRRLASGGVQVVAAEEFQADWWLAAHPDVAAHAAKAPLRHQDYDPLHFVFSAKSPGAGRAAELGGALAEMIRDGSLFRILERYAGRR